MRPNPRARVVKFMAAAAVASIALVGCASAQPGSAAVVGDTKITESTIRDQMRTLNETLGQPADTPSVVATRGLVTQQVTGELINQTAARVGVSVPAADVDIAFNAELERMGGQEALAAAAAQAFVTPDQIKEFLATRLLFSVLAERLSPDATPNEKTEAAVNAVVKTGDEVGVSVAPRYGEWSPSQLQIVPHPDPVSKPAGLPENPLGQLIPQQQAPPPQ